MKQKMAGLILVAVLASVLLSGCGSGTEQTSTESDGSYQEIELVMAVNGTDIQIDTKVAKKFAELVEEESGGRVTVAVFPNDQLAGGNSTKGIEMIAVGHNTPLELSQTLALETQKLYKLHTLAGYVLYPKLFFVLLYQIQLDLYNTIHNLPLVV